MASHVDIGFVPRAHQRAAHALLGTVRFMVLVWHRRAGKTVWAVVELVLAALRSKDSMARFGYVAPLLKQAKSIAWDYLKRFAYVVPGTVVNESELSVSFPNGARVRLFGGDNPDSLRGLYFNGLVLDEPADMRPNLWGEVLLPTLTDKGGWAVFIGTPKGTNMFSEMYFRALQEPNWAADLRRVGDTGVIGQEELEQARKEMTSAQWAQEMECDWSASAEDVLVRLEDVVAAQRRDVPANEYEPFPLVMGVDVARYGGDRSCIVRRQGPLCFKPRFLLGLDTMTLAGQVAMEIDKHKPDGVFVDAGGVGAGVLDRLRQLRYSVVGVDFGSRAADVRFDNRRVEMWWQMADWVRASNSSLPSMPEVATDLTGPRYTYANARGRVSLESKDDMRARGLRSPDFGDALAMTFYAPVAKPIRTGNRALDAKLVAQAHQSDWDYDPYEERGHV